MEAVARAAQVVRGRAPLQEAEHSVDFGKRRGSLLAKFLVEWLPKGHAFVRQWQAGIAIRPVPPLCRPFSDQSVMKRNYLGRVAAFLEAVVTFHLKCSVVALS